MNKFKGILHDNSIREMTTLIHDTASPDGGEGLLAMVIHMGKLSDAHFVSRTEFISKPSDPLQVGIVQRYKGDSISTHTHIRPPQLPEPQLSFTQEVLSVVRGRARVTLTNSRGSVIRVVTIHPGDVLVMLGGGHGFEFEHDTILLEVKQGPFMKDKVFLPQPPG